MKQNNRNFAGQVLKLCEMKSTQLLPLLQGPLWLGTVVIDTVTFIDQKELLSIQLWAQNDWYQIWLLIFNSNTWNRLTVSKQMSSHSFKTFSTKYAFTGNIYLIDTYKNDYMEIT